MAAVPRSLPQRLARRTAAALLVVIGVYLVARGVVEVLSVDPSDPASYRQDWGGPSYLGVVSVHAGPGLLVIVAALVWWRRRRAE
jgi:uncharacterized membrane protein HdeD (DUF308 family)